MTKTSEVTKAVTTVEKQTGFTKSQIALIKKTVAIGATDEELMMFAHIAKKAGLDPFLKEVWYYKDKKGNSIIFVGRDGFLKVAHKSGEFRGIKSGAVHEKDEFEVDMANNAVKHIIKNPIDRGKLIAAWATVYRKDCEPKTVFVDNATYNKGWNTWQTHPDAMLQKVAENIALKSMFGLTGVYSEEERDSILEQPPVPVALPTPVVPVIDTMAEIDTALASIGCTTKGKKLEVLNTRLGMTIDDPNRIPDEMQAFVLAEVLRFKADNPEYNVKAKKGME